MERVWSKKLPIFFAVCGGICLIGSAVLCAGLDRGGYLDHIAVALAMLLMAPWSSPISRALVVPRA